MREDLLAVLRAEPRKMVPLHEFFYQGRDGFYANSAVTYPQGWALVHFLRKTSRPNQKLFRELFQALRSGASRREALDRGLRGVDIARLEAAFRRYVMELGAATATPPRGRR